MEHSSSSLQGVSVQGAVPMKFIGVKDLCDLPKQIGKRLRFKARHAYLFGSVANGSAVPFESDVDVLIVPKTRLSADEAFELLKKPWAALIEKGLVLRPIVFDPKRHPAWLLEAAKEGVVLF